MIFREHNMQEAKGQFTISFTPQTSSLESNVNKHARLTFAKEFIGDLVGQSHGEMLSCRSATEGSAGYVAIEILEVTLDGKGGSFVFQHSSTMNKGVPQQSIQVVPDSGTGELSGIRGSFEIQIVGGEHYYTFLYEIPGG
jgi:hypothetical protein